MKLLKTYGKYEVVEEQRKSEPHLYYVRSQQTGYYYGGWQTEQTARKYAREFEKSKENL